MNENENKHEDVIETVKVEEQKEVMQEQTENVQENDKKGLSIASMILGIISIVFFFKSFISVATGVLAIVFGLKGKKMDGKGMAKAGFITGIIGLSIQAIFFLTGVILGLAFVGLVGSLI